MTLTKPFYMGKYEVSQEQWQAVFADNPSNHSKSAFRDWGTPRFNSPRLGFRLGVDVPLK